MTLVTIANQVAAHRHHHRATFVYCLEEDAQRDTNVPKDQHFQFLAKMAPNQSRGAQSAHHAWLAFNAKMEKRKRVHADIIAKREQILLRANPVHTTINAATRLKRHVFYVRLDFIVQNLE